ncbi:mitochondrial organization of gene expression protein 2 [Haematococcus lacustris]|uniref:Mitochondrial organization of gene expression protein 2 n=1 Tax=Haematococcus lacustris TaxID=44745 RepID=A0A699YL07_HAELA|nr:mitochondrial organization of gene expression protein 2 [Haematococcus lacustris]
MEACTAWCSVRRCRSVLGRLSGTLTRSALTLGCEAGCQGKQREDVAVADAGDAAQVTEGNGALNKLIVFGGRGFVGSAIVQEAVEQGLQVVSVSRSGKSLNSESLFKHQTFNRSPCKMGCLCAHNLSAAGWCLVISCATSVCCNRLPSQLEGYLMLRQLCPTWPAGTPPVQRHSWMETGSSLPACHGGDRKAGQARASAHVIAIGKP